MQRDKQMTRTECSYILCEHYVKFIISPSKNTYEEEKKKYHILPGTCRVVSLKYVHFSEGRFDIRRAKEGEPVSRNKIINNLHKSRYFFINLRLPTSPNISKACGKSLMIFFFNFLYRIFYIRHMGNKNIY